MPKTYPNNFETKLIALDQLSIDDDYQRGRKGNSDHIGANYDPLIAGAIIVACRKSKKMIIIDGQQRWKGAKIAGYKEILCLVFPSTGITQEAKLFAELNGKHRVRVTPGENFRAALCGRVPSALKIKEITTKLGFELSLSPIGPHQWPMIQAISGIEKIYKLGGPGGLESILHTIKELWVFDANSLKGDFLLGFWAFYDAARKNDGFDIKRMKETFKGIKPATIIQQALLESIGIGVSGFQRYRFIQLQLFDYYDKGVQTKAKIHLMQNI